MQDKQEKSVFIAGCGYIGQRVAALMQASGNRVTGLVRSVDSATQLEQQGIHALCADLDALTPGSLAMADDDVFYFAPPPREGDSDTRVTAFLRVLDARPPRRIVYISTSAVYGDCQGEWIDESQPPNPNTGRGRRRLDAEQQLTRWCLAQAVELTILRVPGIYGPGKLPLARLEKGLPVLREEDAPFTNRIHADDLAEICVAAMQHAVTNTVFNVSDGHPSNMTDYFFRVADAAGLPRPRAVDLAEAERVLSKHMLSFLRDSRRMKNEKLLNELEIILQYPELAQGLAHCFGANARTLR